jgi:Transposase, Mutator family
VSISSVVRFRTRRVRRALRSVFGGEIGKDTVSRVWRKVKGDWDAWNSRSLADEPIVRLILDGTVVRVRLDRKATSIDENASGEVAPLLAFLREMQRRHGTAVLVAEIAVGHWPEESSQCRGTVIRRRSSIHRD